uniref:RanBD1 domain-containing protein n=1 Tax=Soboliphyme baturini TaxID=241478 RepID=A0A183IM95_9BILA
LSKIPIVFCSKINFSFSAKLQDSPNDRSASPSSVVTTTTDLICSTKQQSDENEAKPLNELDSETKASDDGRDSKLKIDAAGDIKETCTTTDSNQDDNRAADVNVKPQFQFKFDFPKSETFQISAPEATKPSDTNVSAAVEPTFSFGASLGSSSTSFAATMNSEVTTSAEDDEAAYVPPAVQLQPITEEGSTYSVKCKLFFKLPDKEYQERGIGYLFLKPTDDAKTQLIVRADNTLGNILLNILLTAATRHSRVGKNNVSLAAVPNPPLEGSQNPSDPVVFLIRVRTAEDADQLFEQITEIGLQVILYALLAEFAAMSREAAMIRVLSMFLMCFSCAVAQSQAASTRLTGYDETFSVRNIPSEYTDACTFDMYINYICNNRKNVVHHGDRETRNALQILEVKYN